MLTGGEQLEHVDLTLAALARRDAAVRLRIGQALEVLGRGGVFELGFSSLGAYAVERCERSARWAEAARCMARRAEELPALRHALALGAVSWSMGELLARVAQPGEDEARWLELAEGRTVRQMRAMVAMARSERGARAANDEAATDEAARDEGAREVASIDADPAERCTLTLTLDQEEAWLFEATRSLLDQLGAHGAEEQCEALLAEVQGTLLARSPAAAFELDRWQVAERQRAHWNARWRAEAEALSETLDGGWRQRAARHGDAPEQDSVALAAALGLASLERSSLEELDRCVRSLAASLARQELELARSLLRFHRMNGWRRLGYATEAQYARERLGLRRSSLLARRALALRLEKLPKLTAALAAGQVGVEAALLLGRVATATTEAAWIERARQRTIKHLREEVAAALVAVRCSGELDCPPPRDADLEAYQALEQAVLSGRVFEREPHAGDVERGVASETGLGSESRRAWLVMLASLADWLAGTPDGGVQTSAAANAAPAGTTSHAGRVTLRLQVSQPTRAWWRQLQALGRACLPPGMTWLRFACLAVWRAWQRPCNDAAYAHIYERDRYRCMNPVCPRRDVTPHHLVFRSHGGSEDPLNLISLCTWCHLQGVHGGRIRAHGTAELVHWELGPLGAPSLVVHGRERVAA